MNGRKFMFKIMPMNKSRYFRRAQIWKPKVNTVHNLRVNTNCCLWKFWRESEPTPTNFHIVIKTKQILIWLFTGIVFADFNQFCIWWTSMKLDSNYYYGNWVLTKNTKSGFLFEYNIHSQDRILLISAILVGQINM